MADWVHCNLCFKQPFEVKSQFNLTNCGHIYCEDCLKQAPGFCQMCKQKCSCIHLSNKMKPEVERFFNAPKDTLKQLLQVMDFQDGHRQRLVQYRRNTGITQQTAFGDEKMAAAFSELQRELQKLKEENYELKKALAMLRNQHQETTIASCNSTPYNQSLRHISMARTPGSIDQRCKTRPLSQSQAGNTPGSALQQNKMKAPSERVSIRTPPVGGVISTPSPCKLYRPNGSGGYTSSQQQSSQRGRTIQGSQNSPAASQMRSRSSTPIQSLSRHSTPNRYQSPCGHGSLNSIRASQKHTPTDSTPQNVNRRTPYTVNPECHSSPMQVNSSLDPAQRQIRLSYQPRTALLSQSSSK